MQSEPPRSPSSNNPTGSAADLGAVGAELAEIFDHERDAVVDCDLQGRITSWPPEAVRLYGHEPEQAIGRHISILAGEHHRAEQALGAHRALQGRDSGSAETIRYHRDRTPIPVSILAVTRRDEHGTVAGLTAVHRDLRTPRDDGPRDDGPGDEADVARTGPPPDDGGTVASDRPGPAAGPGAGEALLAGIDPLAVLDALPDVVAVMHPVRDEAGRLVDFVRAWVNEGGAARLGRDPEELVGKGLWDVWDGTSAQTALGRLAHVLASGEPARWYLTLDEPPTRLVVRARRLGPDSVLLLKTPLGAGGLDLDLDAAHHQWPGLAGFGLVDRAAEQVEEVLRLSPAPTMVVVDPPDPSIAFANPAFGALVGATASSLNGVAARNFLRPMDLPGSRAGMESLIAGRADRWDGRLTVHCVDGREVSCDAVVASLALGGSSAYVVTLNDLTVQLARELALVSSEAHFRSAFESSPIGMAMVGLDGAFLDVNDALCRFFELPRAELLARSWQQLTHPDDLSVDEALAAEVLAGSRTSYQLEKRYITGRGGEVWGRLGVSLATQASGAPLHFIAQVLDISAEVTARDLLRADAVTDPLTGLANRRSLEDMPADGSGLRGVLYADLDGFKGVNDRLGHRMGDQLLRVVAHRLGRAVRPADHLVRLGGDEFAVICPVRAAADLDRLADRLGAVMDDPITLDGAEVRVGVTVGRATGPPGAPLEDLLARADEDLYRRKARRPGRSDRRDRRT